MRFLKDDLKNSYYGCYFRTFLQYVHSEEQSVFNFFTAPTTKKMQHLFSTAFMAIFLPLVAPPQKDARKLTKIASGTGVYSQWTANGTTPNYNCTNKVPAQTVDYVSGATVGIYDSYGMGNAGLTVNPNMVLARSYAKKVDSAVHTIEIGVLGAGATIGLGTTYTLTSGYVYTDACIATDPATGNPPLAAAADAFQHLKYLSE